MAMAMLRPETSTCMRVCRRSARLQNKDYQSRISLCVESDPLGYFALLPIELMHYILNSLRIEDLGFLGITSKAVRDIVLGYIRSKFGLKRLQLRQIAPSRRKTSKRTIGNSQLNHFKNVGLMLKRTTCLFPTRERLMTLEYFVSQLQCVHKLFTCQALSCYGNLLSTFTRGWEERECLRVYYTISESLSMVSKTLLSGNPGSNPAVEIQTRRFFRHVLLDQCTTMEDLSMWLHFILAPFPMVHQARLLYLLYGPLCQNTNTIFWDCMGLSYEGYREIRSRTSPLGQIAMAVKALATHRSWSDDSVISVVEELIGCPDEWLTENVARLLILCGEPMTLKVLGSKAINGKMSELGSIVVAFSVVLQDEGRKMSLIIKMVHQLCRMMTTAEDIKTFLGCITAAYGNFFSVYAPEDEGTHMQLLQTVRALTGFMYEMMQELFGHRNANKSLLS